MRTSLRRGSIEPLAVMLVATLMVPAAWSRDPDTPTTWPGLTRSGSVLLPNGWSLKPAGRQSRLGDFPVLVAVHPKESVLAVQHAGYGDHEILTLDAAKGQVIGRVSVPTTFTGMTWSPDGSQLYVAGGFDDVVHRFDHKGGLLSNHQTWSYPKPSPDSVGAPANPARPERPGSTTHRVTAGLAVSPDAKTLFVANAFGHSIGIFNTDDGKLKAEINLGTDSYPYGLAFDAPTNRLFVSLWGRAAVAVVNIDAQGGKETARWASQEHPNEMLLTKNGKTLFVANANRNTVTVFDTTSGQAVEMIGTAIAPDAPAGCTPSSLALTPDESTLLVANATTNDLAVINVKEPGKSVPMGFVPTGWYPTSVRVARDGKTIYVANGKGTTSRANRDGPNPVSPEGRSIREYIGGLFQGTLSIIPMPTAKDMVAYSQTVYTCSPLKTPRERDTRTSPIPARVGDPSPIKHVIYIIKENRTYDQVFGDQPKGNGEPAICLFPEEITPNHHALASEFVLLDNFYVDGEVSADGHEWTMGAYASDFVEKIWPLGYRGDRRVPYPAEGAFDIAKGAGGYLWDRARAKNVSYRSYGEFIQNAESPDQPATTRVETLKGHFDPKFRSYDLKYPDVKRAGRFLEELAEFEAKGEMPSLIVMRLPNDHTAGTSPGSPTVQAYVADNDLALGMVVDGLSRSKFWPTLAIFVVEDDAQNGSDHVDAHRTVALAISPYIKRGSVDSTMYSTSSMLRTMELILGLDPMSQFDAAARPMDNAFTNTPDLTPYTKRPARIDLNAKNQATAWGAERSLKLNLAKEDQADDLIFNEIIWKAVKGADSIMPPPLRSAFFLPREFGGDKDKDKDDDDD